MLLEVGVQAAGDEIGEHQVLGLEPLLAVLQLNQGRAAPIPVARGVDRAGDAFGQRGLAQQRGDAVVDRCARLPGEPEKGVLENAEPAERFQVALDLQRVFAGEGRTASSLEFGTASVKQRLGVLQMLVQYQASVEWQQQVGRCDHIVQMLLAFGDRHGAIGDLEQYLQFVR